MTTEELIRSMRTIKYDRRWQKGTRCPVKSLCRVAGVSPSAFNWTCLTGRISPGKVIALSPFIEKLMDGCAQFRYRKGHGFCWEERAQYSLLPMLLRERKCQLVHGGASIEHATPSSSTLPTNPQCAHTAPDQ
jgi:hypothetical protein